MFDSRIDAALFVHADADKMRQVFLNLLINAVQSMECGGNIRVEAVPEDHTVTLRVIDSGCGVPAEQIEQIFAPFFTTKEKGTGLGLAIASKIVEGHGGRLAVTSEPGAGSTFHVILPRASA